MIPIMTPVMIRRSMTCADSFSGLPFFLIRIKTSRNKPPSIPREKESNAEESGIYRRNTPTVPKISIEEIKMPNALLLFVFSVLVVPI